MKQKLFLFLFVLTLFWIGCDDKDSTAIVVSPTSLLPSDFPPDLDVPSLAGSTTLNGKTAFVVQDSPFSIIPVDIDSLSLSSTFPVVDLTSVVPSGGTVFGSDLFIATETLAAVCYSGRDGNGNHITGVVLFNPSTGGIYKNINCRQLVSTSYKTLRYSATSGVSYTYVSNFLTSFAAGVVIVGNRLFVCTSNLDPSDYTTFYPGTVFVFDISNPQNPQQLGVLFMPQVSGQTDPDLRYFNPTQLTLFGGQILVTCSGAVEFDANWNSVAVSNGAVVLIDPSTSAVLSHYHFGNVGFSGEEIVIYNDGTDDIAVLASQVEGKLYRINLSQGSILNSEANPIVVTNLTTNEILSVAVSTNVQYFFVASFFNNELYVVDISSANSTPSTPTILQTVQLPSGSQRPGNVEILSPLSGQERAIYTIGTPADLGILLYP